MSNRMKRSNKKNMEDEKISGSEESEPESEISEVIEDVADLDFDDNEEEEGDEEDDDNIDETELKKENEIDDDDIIDCFYDFEQNEVNNIQNNDVPKEDRITMPYLTKYESVRVLGTRAKQISLGAKILVKDVDLTTKSPIEIAKIELSLGIIPFKIRRPLPNGKVEEWKISELVKPS
jgi:DNA-directed RNA polymerase I, II, and III subunit RPABC2